MGRGSKGNDKHMNTGQIYWRRLQPLFKKTKHRTASSTLNLQFSPEYILEVRKPRGGSGEQNPLFSN